MKLLTICCIASASVANKLSSPYVYSVCPLTLYLYDLPSQDERIFRITYSFGYLYKPPNPSIIQTLSPILYLAQFRFQAQVSKVAPLHLYHSLSSTNKEICKSLLRDKMSYPRSAHAHKGSLRIFPDTLLTNCFLCFFTSHLFNIK